MRFAFLILMCLPALSVTRGQNIDFSVPVSFTYNGETLLEVMEDLNSRYHVKFSYSPQVVPLQYPLYAVAEDEPFRQALKLLFDETPIIYGFIGDQLLLSVDPDLLEDPLAAEIDSRGELLYASAIEQADRSPIAPPEGLTMRPTRIELDSIKRILLESRRDFIEQEQARLIRNAERSASATHAQVTLVPPLSLTTRTSKYQPVNISVNVLWGRNLTLDGFEMGLVSNRIEMQANGVQMCGIYNGVGENLTGAQFAGLINKTGGETTGAQMSGIANIASTGGDLVQLTGVVNIAKGPALAQGSLLGNVGGDVKITQIGTLFNICDSTKLQFALFNFAESSNASIGLLSFIRNGYRSLELAGEEALHANLNFRLGVRRFYNIIHIGSTIDLETWSLGYGIGTSFPTGPRNYLQMEIMTRHINENEPWTSTLNLLNQFNLFWDARLGRSARVTFGPTFNVAVSRRFDPDSGKYGTDVAPYTFYDRTALDASDRQVNVKMWAGFHIGLRLNSKEELPPGI